ncbi:MAG TPA: hypothetical protein VIT92_05850, partial [Burkholderiaceae bacterium]
MKRIPKLPSQIVLASASLLLAFASSLSVAGDTDLADVPLANATTTTILPNIMFSLDNSGSMQWDYMPDYVRYTSQNTFGKYCRGNDGSLRVCEQGDPPYYNSAFNGLYYNPATRYSWPVNADGTPKADHTGKTSYTASSTWTSIPSDGYGVQANDTTSNEALSTSPCSSGCSTVSATSTINLLTSYPERYYCTNSSQTAPGPNCRRALDLSSGTYSYIYPNSTYGTMKRVLGGPIYYTSTVQWCNQVETSGVNQ